MLFVSNHNHTSKGEGLVSSMRGIPITTSSDGDLINVRNKEPIDPAILEDGTSSEHVEEFHFGGLVMFEFTKHAKPRPKAVRAIAPQSNAPLCFSPSLPCAPPLIRPSPPSRCRPPRAAHRCHAPRH